jgi:N-acetylmuramoyl-L-alanine amidase
MNTPSPLVPQGTFQDKGKSHVRITVFAILAIHVVLLGVLLIAGCNKKSTGTDLAENNGVPPVPPVQDNNWPPAANTTDKGAPPPSDAIIPPVPPPPNAPGATDVVAAPTTGGAITPANPNPLDNTPPPPIPHTDGVTEHVVAKGETLDAIGKKYGVGYKAIEAANPGVTATRLKIGQKLQIPAKAVANLAPTATPNGTTGGTIYVVKSGDNLLKISKATGVSVKQLRAANNLKYDQIRVGQKLKIPAHGSAPTEAAVPPVPIP